MTSSWRRMVSGTLLICLFALSRAADDCFLDGTCDMGDESAPTVEEEYEQNVFITNRCNGPVDILWVGQTKVLIDTIAPQQALNIHSFLQHRLEVRDHKTGKTLRTHKVMRGDARNRLIIQDSTQPIQEISKDLGQLQSLSSDIYPKYLDYQGYRSSHEIPMGAKFRNFYGIDLDYYFDDGSKDGVYNGLIPSMGRSMINTYTTHSFKIYRKGTRDLIRRVTMTKGDNLIILEPTDPNKLKAVKQTQFYKDTMVEKEFMKQYKESKGLPWLSYYPRDQPTLHMWPADAIGQDHAISAPEGYSREDGSVTNEGVELKLTVASIRPRVLFIQKLLNDVEIAHIIEHSKNKVARSAVGSAGAGFVTETRTSRTTWIKRGETKIMNNLFRRFAKVLNISDSDLTHDKTAESLQVVHYQPGQKYAPHHDFHDKGLPAQRFLTLFIYLKSPSDKSGGTGFPLAFGGRGLKVTPPPGSAVLWYNMLPDGNADELSLHEGITVDNGEKWGCNLWVWDPHVSF